MGLDGDRAAGNREGEGRRLVSSTQFSGLQGAPPVVSLAQGPAHRRERAPWPAPLGHAEDAAGGVCGLLESGPGSTASASGLHVR